MHINVISGIKNTRADDFKNKTAIVIDALRATSNIVTGLHSGSSGIVPVETVEEALSLQNPGDLLCGERDCLKIPGFDLGNSPFEYKSEQVRGKRILMTTTNGTKVLQKSLKAAHILAASFLNAAACAKAAEQFKKDILIICAGTKEEYSLEDGLCAGLLLEEFQKNAGTKEEIEVNDFGLAMHSAYLQERNRLAKTMLNCANGKRLTSLGFREDVKYCSQINQLETVPVWRSGELVPLLVTIPSF